ncbi:hypothetical protein UZ36_02655 [Candidatus Nitromaritima sp. SCGC AAA799-C22]|nr:hypothetical protein UZ36_02655 [Candidatus Nitromaritima sp. SCGC AAA799-C22]
MKDTFRKLITCILPKGKALEIIDLLKKEKGIETTNFHTGRGIATSQSVSYGKWTEDDILTIVIGSDRADEIFAYIYEKVGIQDKPGAFMYQSALKGATQFTLPEIPEKKEK